MTSRNINFKHRVAVVGAGLTLFRSRMLETPQELAWLAAKQALDEAGLTLKDIDCVVIGSAPDAFDGVHMKGEYLAEGAGGIHKPVIRVFVGGATGVFVPIAAWWHVASGLCKKVLAVAEEKMSHAAKPHTQYVFRYIWDPIVEKPLNPNLIWIFAMEMHRYMYKCGVKKEDIALVSVKNKRNACGHPSAQLCMPNITVDDVLKSEVLVWPVQLLDISPTSDGAAAVVLASEEEARRITDTPVWIKGIGWTLDTTHWTNRDLAYPEYVRRAAEMAYRMAGIDNPRKQIDVAEPYDPFDYKELHHMEGLGLARKCEAPILTREGVTQRDGDLPINPSGGLLGVGNPIAAAGLMKVAEIFWQVRGEAGARQVKKPVYTGLAQAWGDLMQAGTVIVMGI
ncbi:MAG: thiolase domain-containing protein [Pyrobaculum arsenaticum]|uniref:Acetyl-CoA C-acyltransferase n=2 Tax=Pyrobaculum aerophilum TaxID=13773 RepID=Q8ZV25_PYRAE|nr:MULTISPECIES: thiolase domain-containing protein [Pyrobaculum]AAL64231.1 acetyl-CoA C-acyltransferase [Pyrobaculum aerophilum str. IM2]MCY0891389.1 thiolase domain-containing protein [Pyrobaculum arsenaticum]HII47010.1 thiolase domain-containing protein [Pyrobaculum aerophilum]